MPDTPLIDARADRVVEGVVAIALLATFVFREPLLVPVIGLLVAFGAVFGPRANPLHIAFDTLITPRLPSSDERIPGSTVRFQDVLVAVLVALGSLAFLADGDPVGWGLTLIAAGVALLAATTGIHVSTLIRERLGRDGE